jgi:hypothetical protein
MDTALHPHCPSGALGREEFLALLLIVLHNATPPHVCPLSTVSCCPLQGMGWAQYQMTQLWG